MFSIFFSIILLTNLRGDNMGLNEIEKIVENILESMGIATSEQVVLVIMILSSFWIFVAYYYLMGKIKCKKITCDKINNSITSTDSILEDVIILKNTLSKMREAGDGDHRALLQMADRLDSDVDKIRETVLQLNNILITGGNKTARRRIEYEGK